MDTTVTAPERSPGVLGQTLRRLAREAGPDIFSDETAAPTTHLWIYGPGEYEAGALTRVVEEGFAVNRHVDYAMNFGRPRGRARFAVEGPAGVAVRLRIPEGSQVSIDGVPLGPDETLRLPGSSGGARVEIDLVTADGGPACLGLRTQNTRLRWFARPAQGPDRRIDGRPGGDTPPHLTNEPAVSVDLVQVGPELWESPAPVLGRIELHGVEGVPVLRSGESREEALDDRDTSESRHDLVSHAGVWSTKYRLGFRYVRVAGARVGRVTVLANVRSVSRRGAFATSDSTLTSMWAVSAYTLRSCMQTFLVDGIKRDRMPWAGDTALGILTNAYTFADNALLRDTLTALSRPQGGYINGITDYSLWWIIAHGFHDRYFGDEDFLRDQAPQIVAILSDLMSHADQTDGLLRTPDLPGQFGHAGSGGFFLDWGVSSSTDSTLTALQVLWYWAVRTAADLLRRVGDAAAATCDALAQRIADSLRTRAWDHDAGHWTAEVDKHAPSAYPNFLAPLSGLLPPDDGSHATMANAVRDDRAGTPFMRLFALLGLVELGAPDVALAEMRAAWGEMQNRDSMTFWEEFGTEPGKNLEMYGRPFGKSLAHAWAAGPAAALPVSVLGIEPLAPGWSRYVVDPHIGSLAWAGAVVPTPHGDIEVWVDAERLVAHSPEGVTLHYRGNDYTGSVDLPMVADRSAATTLPQRETIA